MSQELLTQMATAMAKGDWAAVAEIAGQIAMQQQAPAPKASAPKASAPKKEPRKKISRPSAATEAPEAKPAFINKFIDDKTLEKAHIASDRKLLKGMKPTSRRPPSANKPVEVFCPKCNKPHMVASSLVALRRETDSGIVCPSCLRSNRR